MIFRRIKQKKKSSNTKIANHIVQADSKISQCPTSSSVKTGFSNECLDNNLNLPFFFQEMFGQTARDRRQKIIIYAICYMLKVYSEKFENSG